MLGRAGDHEVGSAGVVGRGAGARGHRGDGGQSNVYHAVVEFISVVPVAGHVPQPKAPVVMHMTSFE